MGRYTRGKTDKQTGLIDRWPVRCTDRQTGLIEIWTNLLTHARMVKETDRQIDKWTDEQMD